METEIKKVAVEYCPKRAKMPIGPHLPPLVKNFHTFYFFYGFPKEGEGQTTTPEEKYYCLIASSTTHPFLTVRHNERTTDPRCIDGGAILQAPKKDGTMMKYCIAKKRDPKTKETIKCEYSKDISTTPNVPLVAHIEQASDGENELVSSS